MALEGSADDIRRLSEDRSYWSDRLEDLNQRWRDYRRQRDELLRRGWDDDLVMPGSIVTLSYRNSSDTETFVLSDRDSDDEYETLRCSSNLGSALAGKRQGESASYRLPSGRVYEVTVISVRPGFRPISSRDSEKGGSGQR